MCVYVYITEGGDKCKSSNIALYGYVVDQLTALNIGRTIYSTGQLP